MVELHFGPLQAFWERCRVLATGMPKLKILDLHECNHVADDAVVKIVSSAQCLVFLDLVNCRKVTDKSLRAVLNSCERLVAIALGGANKISDPVLNEFRARKPNVVVNLHFAQKSGAMAYRTPSKGGRKVNKKQRTYIILSLFPLFFFFTIPSMFEIA